MVSPIVRQLFEELVTANPGERQSAAASSSALDQHELGELLHLLGQHVQRQTDGREGVDGLLALIDRDIPGATEALLRALALLPAPRVEPSIAFELQTLTGVKKVKRAELQRLLERWSTTRTRIGAAAKAVLEDMNKATGGAG